MRVINVSLSELENKILMIGFQGENQITQVRIDAAEILTDHPNATPTLIAKPLFGFAYPVIVTKEGTDVVWEIDNSVLSFNGDGEIQLTFTEGTVIAKSYVGRIRIKRSLAVNGEKPDPIETWEQAATAKLAEVDAQISELEDMVEAAEAAKDEAQDIVDDAAADIQAAGAAQVQVVQAKGTEVLNSIPSDYSTLSGDVNGLKSAITPYNYSVTENLFIKRTLTNGYNLDIATGALVALGTHSTTDFIPIDAGETYYVSEPSGSTRVEIPSSYVPKICFYDSNKNYISNSGTNGSHATAPESAKYMRFSCYNLSALQILMIGKSIQPYIDAKIIAEDYLPKTTAISNATAQATSDIMSIGYFDQTDSIGSGLTWTSGYVTKGGNVYTSTSYHYSESIPVSPGDTISSNNSFRFVTAYVNGTAVEVFGEENVSSYTVPDTVNAVIVTLAPSQTSINHTYKTIFDGMANHVKEIEEKIDGATFNNDITVFKASAASLTNGQTLTACTNIDNKKGDTIIFYANLNHASFGSVTVGHGENVMYGASVTVDNTKVTISYGTTSDYYHTDHGLTIDKFLMIKIKHTDNARADIQIETASGQFSIASSNVAWGGCIGGVFAESKNSTLTNVLLSSTFADFEQDIFLFGDSYVGLGDSSRYATVLINNGYTNLMIDGYGGRNSASAMLSFRQIIQAATPKYLIWALGMNDADSETAINASYKTCLDEVIATCETYNVIPILATIPNTPTRIHTFKNAYVKSLGYRFIDFAKAVGAEEAGSTWWDGMLEANDTPSSRIHPTELGAKALYARFLIDVPEIANLH